MASTGAPVCSDSKDEVFTQLVPNNFPSIPKAQVGDENSIVNAINALRAAVMLLSGRTGGPAPKKFTPQFNGFTSTKTDARWSEKRSARSLKKVKVTNPQDPTQFVEVEQINGLTFVDRVTGEQIIWKR